MQNNGNSSLASILSSNPNAASSLLGSGIGSIVSPTVGGPSASQLLTSLSRELQAKRDFDLFNQMLRYQREGTALDMQSLVAQQAAVLNVAATPPAGRDDSYLLALLQMKRQQDQQNAIQQQRQLLELQVCMSLVPGLNSITASRQPRAIQDRMVLPVSASNLSPEVLAAASLTGLGNEVFAAAGLTGLGKVAVTYPKKEPSKVSSASKYPSPLQQDMIHPPCPRRKGGRSGKFPLKLHDMLTELERQGRTDIASFLPHGRGFVIHNSREFTRHVMSKYFRMSHFSSFQRQLNLYDFQRASEGPEKGSYCVSAASFR